LAAPATTVVSVVGDPIVVAPCFTVNVTEPLFIAGPLAGVTVALSVTDAAPKVAVALETVVVVLTVAELTIRVSVLLGVAPAPWQPAPLLVPVTVNVYVPVGVEALVVTLSEVTIFV